jgi:hypothetical protein
MFIRSTVPLVGGGSSSYAKAGSRFSWSCWWLLALFFKKDSFANCLSLLISGQCALYTQRKARRVSMRLLKKNDMSRSQLRFYYGFARHQSTEIILNLSRRVTYTISASGPVFFHERLMLGLSPMRCVSGIVRWVPQQWWAFAYIGPFLSDFFFLYYILFI